MPALAQCKEHGKGQHRPQQNGNRIALPEPFGKPFRRGPGRLRLGDKRNHPCHGRFAQFAPDLDGQNAIQVDRRLKNLCACRLLHRHGFAGDGGFVNRAFPLDDDPVHRHPRTGPQDDHIARRKRFDRHLHHRLAHPPQGPVGAQFHQRLDGLPGAAHGAVLKRGGQAEQRQQNGPLQRRANSGGGKGGDNHQQIDVKLPFFYQGAASPDRRRNAARQKDACQGKTFGPARAKAGKTPMQHRRRRHAQNGQRGQ